ncbi:hypothetical protein P4S64_21330 [Vibrio sp. M60_M31a]
MPDINGLITSRTITSPNGKIKFALNSTSAKQTSAQRFLNAIKVGLALTRLPPFNVMIFSRQ